MKNCITLALCYFTCLPLSAQIMGKVDAGENPAYVNVILLAAQDSSFVIGTQSEGEGNFQLSAVPTGAYILHLSALGFADWYSAAFSWTAGGQKDFGTISLVFSAIALDGVEVTAKKMLLQQHSEGMVINVSGSLMTQGSSALQVLERSPGVFIDQRNNTISLNGQNGVGVMINGKRLRLSLQEVVVMLQGMSADNIEKIELLTSPSAKYEAAGSGGLINIVLKKKEGFGTNGSLSLSGGYGEGEKAMTSARVNHNAGNTFAYASYTYSLDETAEGFYGFGSNIVPALGGKVGFEILNNNQRRLSNHNLNLGLETQVADRTTVGGSLIAQKSGNRNSVLNLIRYDLNPDSLIRMNIQVNGDNPGNNWLTNLYVEQDLGGQSKVKLDLDYLSFDSKNPTLARSQYFDKEDVPIYPGGAFFASANRGRSETNIDIGVVKFDVEKMLGDQFKWEAGLKGTYSKTANLAQIERQQDQHWILDDRSVTAVDLYEGIAAAYTSFHYTFSAATDMTLGARYEYWERTSPEDKRIQRRLFPSLFFSHAWSDVSHLQFSFTQRVTRPDYHDLASFLRYNDPISVFTGNPLLKPTISHNLRLGHQWKAYNFSLNFIHEENPIVRYQVVENETKDLVLVAPQNMFYQRYIYLQTDIPIELASGWNANVGGSGGLRKFKLSHTKEQVEKQYWTFQVYGNQTVELPWRFSLEISGWYNAPTYDGSRKYEGFGMLNAGIRKQLKNNQGSIQFTVSDLFKSMRIVSDFGHLTEEAFSSTADVVYRPESARTRIYRLSFFHNFGNAKVKTKRERQVGASEERSRVRH